MGERVKRILATVAGLLMISVAAVPLAPAGAQLAGIYLCNERISVFVTQNGRLSFGAYPDPTSCLERADGQSFALSGGWPGNTTSFTTLVVDGARYRYGDGSVVQTPTNTSPTTTTSAQAFGGVLVRQTVAIVTNPLTGKEDAARITYEFFDPRQRPPGTGSRVGIRFMIDTQLGTNVQPPIVTDDGVIRQETDIAAGIPSQFRFGARREPRKGGAILSSDIATQPIRFVVAPLSSLDAQEFDYTNGGASMPFDTAYAAYWQIDQLAPQRTMSFSTVFGLGGTEGGPCIVDEETQCGTDGDDTLEVRNGTVRGGPGNDIIHVIVDPETGEITADGGDGDDTFLLTIEDPNNTAPVHMLGMEGNDSFRVPKNPGVLEAEIDGGGDHDTMRVYVPEPSAPRVSLLQATLGRYLFDGGGGNDDVISGIGADILHGDLGRDKIVGGRGSDQLWGDRGEDALRGNAGANIFYGGTGEDSCVSDDRRDKFNSCEHVRRNHRRNHSPGLGREV
ncbi:MAG: calcium-binding protein [Actinomycetota bacterium]